MNLINKYWPNLGGVIGFAIITTILLNGRQVFSIQSLTWLHLAILLLHQFEEYSIPGKFKKFYNTNIWNKNPITRFELNHKGILIVNVILAWTAYLIAAIYGEKLIWLTIGLSGLTILNGIMHTFMFIKLKKYNPGLITGLLIFIPFGTFLLTRIAGNIEQKYWMMGLIVFIIGTVSIPLTIRLTNKTTVPNKVYK